MWRGGPRPPRHRCENHEGQASASLAEGVWSCCRTRHHLDAAQLTESAWRRRWEAERWFCQADGESGKRYGNETIRNSPGGEVSIKLPAPLTQLANTPHATSSPAGSRSRTRGTKWTDRVTADRAIACHIRYDTGRDRWYVTASWQIPPTPRSRWRPRSRTE